MDEDDEVDGLVVEPINPSIFHSEKFYIDESREKGNKNPYDL